MTAIPKRRNGSRKLGINWEQIEELKEKVSEIGEPPLQEKTPSRKDVVHQLAPQLRNAIGVGWTYSQLSNWLAQQGVAIAPETLQQYLNEASNSKPNRETSDSKSEPHSKVSGKLESSARFTPKILDDDDL
jgi:predicted component of type VI protein secretion system